MLFVILRKLYNFCYLKVITHIISSCDEETNEGKLKLSLLMALSEINPAQALSTRAICVEMMKVPSFMLKLCLKYPQDLVGLFKIESYYEFFNKFLF